MSGVNAMCFANGLNMVWYCLLQDEIHLDRPRVCGRSIWCVWEGGMDSASQHSPL